MRARGLGLRAGAVARLLGQDAQVLQLLGLAQHDEQRRDRGDDGEANPDKLDRHAGHPVTPPYGPWGAIRAGLSARTPRHDTVTRSWATRG